VDRSRRGCHRLDDYETIDRKEGIERS